ncbi:Pyridine nucleotide-disulfide oxidoreductase [Gracilaria domingensis]|nr:Pyridine nucleotide-disulfide oxidoreductase [Gracilaria domingensis]
MARAPAPARAARGRHGGAQGAAACRRRPLSCAGRHRFATSARYAMHAHLRGGGRRVQRHAARRDCRTRPASQLARSASAAVRRARLPLRAGQSDANRSAQQARSRTRDVVQTSLVSEQSALPLAVRTRPILRLESAVCNFERLADEAGLKCAHVVVVGAGAAGVELAFALEARLKRSVGDVMLTIVSKHDAISSQFGRATGAAVAAECRKRAIHVQVGRDVLSVDAGVVRLDDDTKLSYDMVVLATGAAAHDVCTKFGLQTCEQGWILVDASLRCRGQSDVFAAGDCVSFDGLFGDNFPPKAGVYAVREGPVLTHNLQQRLNNSSKLSEFVPQASFLSLLSTGDGRGIGTKYGLAFKGTWVYRMKNFIDEKWQQRFRVAGDNRAQGAETEVECSFEGSPVEGAALLLCSEDINEHDSFERQLSVLRRMDGDEAFRNAVLSCVRGEAQKL